MSPITSSITTCSHALTDTSTSGYPQRGSPELPRLTRSSPPYSMPALALGEVVIDQATALGHKRASGTQARSSRSSRVVEHDPALCQLAKQYRDIVRDIIEVHADDSHLLGYQEISDGVVDEDALGRLAAS